MEYGREELRKLNKWVALMVVLLILVLTFSIRLNAVTVKGNSRYTPEEVEQMVFPGFWDRNTLVCMFQDHFRPHKRLPFVEDYDIQITGPFSCDLVVYEKDVVGFVRFMSSNMYFDKDGVIVESSADTLEGIPEIAGLRFGHIVLNQPLPVQDAGLFNEIMNLTQQLRYYGIACDKITFGTSGGTRLTLSGGQIEVELGSGKETEIRISVLHDMLPKLSGLSGTLDLSEYDDSGRSGHVSTFRKRKP